MTQRTTLDHPDTESAKPAVICGVRIDPWIDQLAISPQAKLKMQEANSRMRGVDSFSRCWNRVLTPDETRAIGVSAEEAFLKRSIVGYFAELRGLTPARAMLELACQLDHITINDKDWILRELGEITPAQTIAVTPDWNRESGVLRFRGRKVDISRRADNQRAVLDALQGSAWSHLAPNPFDTPSNVDEQKIHATLRDLNKTTTEIGLRFATEKGQVCWISRILSSLQSDSQ